MNYLSQLNSEDWKKYAKINKLGILKNMKVLPNYPSKNKNNDEQLRVAAIFQNKNVKTYAIFHNFGLTSITNSSEDLYDYENSYNIAINGTAADKKASLEMIKLLCKVCGPQYISTAQSYFESSRNTTQQRFETLKRKTSQYMGILNSVPVNQQSPTALSYYRTKLSKLLISEENLNKYLDYLNSALKIVESESNNAFKQER